MTTDFIEIAHAKNSIMSIGMKDNRDSYYLYFLDFIVDNDEPLIYRAAKGSKCAIVLNPCDFKATLVGDILVVDGNGIKHPFWYDRENDRFIVAHDMHSWKRLNWIDLDATA